MVDSVVWDIGYLVSAALFIFLSLSPGAKSQLRMRRVGKLIMYMLEAKGGVRVKGEAPCRNVHMVALARIRLCGMLSPH